MRAEERCDKVLNKLCDKASSHVQSSAASRGNVVSVMEAAGTSTSALTPDQVSLQDCPVSIQTSCLWGTSMTPMPLVIAEAVPPSNLGPAPSSSAALASKEVSPVHGHDRNFLLPDNFQPTVDAAVQQSLSARFQPSSRGASVGSFCICFSGDGVPGRFNF